MILSIPTRDFLKQLSITKPLCGFARNASRAYPSFSGTSNITEYQWNDITNDRTVLSKNSPLKALFIEEHHDNPTLGTPE